MFNSECMDKHNTKRKGQTVRDEVWFHVYGTTLFALSVITAADYGAIGRNLNFIARILLGTYGFIIPLLGLYISIYIMIKHRWPSRQLTPRLLGAGLLMLVVITFDHYRTFQILRAEGPVNNILDTTWKMLFNERSSGLPRDVGSGMMGAFLYALMSLLFDDVGTIVVLIACFLVGLLLLTGFSYADFAGKMGNLSLRGDRLRELWSDYRQKEKNNKQDKDERPARAKETQVESSEFQRPIVHDFTEAYNTEEAASDLSSTQLELPIEDIDDDEDVVDNQIKAEVLADYKLPSLMLLNLQKKMQLDKKDNITSKSKILTDTLACFGVHARVTDIHRGPAVTRYEVQPEAGVKVSRIVSLSDDIALALAAKGIRIEAPVPGKSVIGIEVPNDQIAMVGLRELLEDRSFKTAKSKLSISLGRSISGEPVVADLSKMPHLLVAGSTGAGKSVCINSIIISLLYNAYPNEVKMIMIDPKIVELNIYNGIPHLLVPVVTDPRKASIALKKVIVEMEKRYDLFARNGVKDIERYNNQLSKSGGEYLPYIVVIIDELADLMMVAASDVEDSICRLAQMARAAGIHLIIATQRPSVDIITGVIKANIPSRIAFAVSSQADSRTILDMGGADKLLGRGDMLYMPIGAAKPIRVQGPLVTDSEVSRVIKAVCKDQDANYNEEMIPTTVDLKNSSNSSADELYDDAVRLVLGKETASISFLQRKLSIGYARAARLIDMMEEQGIIGPYSESSKTREILVTLEDYERPS